MTTRRDFLQNSAAVIGGMVVSSNLAQAKNDIQSIPYQDKLTDDTGKYVLLPLPYAYDALEPVIDARTVELHYNFHHMPAVAAANKAEEGLALARETGDFSLVKHYEKELSLGLSSHILHTIYWTNLSTKGGAPSGALLNAIEKYFKSFDAFMAHLAAATISVEGAGWGVLAYLPASGKLMVLQCENHQKLTTWGVVPILVLDVWEHAYYLKYQNRRAEYVKDLLRLINWDNVAARFDAARVHSNSKLT
jgi:Fe-Mn family superoxide dismutase